MSWNVAGRAGQLRGQLKAVLEREADVIALQEIREATYPAWREGLLAEGYSVVSAVDLSRLPYPPPPYPRRIKQQQIRRAKFNVTAARPAIAQLPGLRFTEPDEARFAFPEKFVAVEVSAQGTVLEVHNAHAPPGSSRYVLKPQALAAVARRIDERPDLPQILCGDFNTPRPEKEGEPPETFAKLYPEVEALWDSAERGILEHPRLRDAYKQVHTPGAPWPVSHKVANSPAPDRRYDHIYVSGHFTVRACRYLTECMGRLSDHAPVEADLELSE